MARKRYEGTGLLPGMAEEPHEPREPASPAKRERRAAARLTTPRAIAYAGAAVLALGLAIFAFNLVEQFLIADPRFALNGPQGFPENLPTLSVTGARHAAPRALEAVFREDQGKSVYLLPLADRRLSLRAVDWVRDASVTRLWPNRVLVHVTERIPVAFVTLGPTRFGLIDEDGVILPRVDDRFRLPVLAGVHPWDPLALHRERVRRMLRLRDDLGDAWPRLSEIDVSDGDNLKVAQPYGGRMLTLLLGDRNFSLRYRNFQNNFKDIHEKLPGAATLDLRLEDRITVVQ